MTSVLKIVMIQHLNPLQSTGNYNATSNNTKLVHWPLMGELLHLVQQGGDWAGPQPAQAPLAVPNVTARPSTASEPTTVLLYNGLSLCSLIVVLKGLINLPSGRAFGLFSPASCISSKENETL